MKDCHYRISPIEYWGKGFNCRLISDTGIPLLVTACCNNNEFSGVVTLKSSGESFALEVFPVRKQIIASTLFFAAY